MDRHDERGIPASFEALAEMARRWIGGEPYASIVVPAPPDTAHAVGGLVDAFPSISDSVLEAIPCELNKASTLARLRHCGVPDEHSADVEVLWSCGCSTAYCEHAFELVSEAASSPTPIMCDVTGVRDIHIVTSRPLRGHSG